MDRLTPTADVTLSPVRVAILHPLRTWAELLELLFEDWPDIAVAVAHTSPDWVCGAVARGDVDVAVVAVESDAFGPDHVQQLREASPHVGLVALSSSTDPDLLAATVRAGARGWLRPTASARELAQVIHGVASGETWLPPELATLVVEALLGSERARIASEDALSKLSTREQEILECLAQGLTRAEISEMFKLSPHTVRTHVNHVLRKLDVHSTLAAVSVVHKAGVEVRRQSRD